MESARHVHQSIEYCKKDGDYFEAGQPPARRPGRRSDLDDFKASVKQGILDAKVLRDLHSEVFARYPRFADTYIQDHLPTKIVESHPWRQWQEELNEYLNRPPVPREIVFVVDTRGNQGKSWFARFYSQTHDKVQILLPGKKADMAYALDQTSRVIFFDAPRSKQGEFIQYDFLEDIKNGYVFSTKYESRFKQLQECHVIVMMNEQPDGTKLSQDRYKIINL